MSATIAHSHSRLGRSLETVALAGIALIVLEILLILTGPNVAYIRPFGRSIFGVAFGSDSVMSVRGELAFGVDFGDRLAWIDTEDGTRDAATGQAPVELGGPVEAELTFLSPTRSQQAAWAVGELSGPVLALAGLVTVHRLVRSTRLGDPFTTENQRRLSLLALIVAVGGTLHGLITAFVDMLLIQRSAAADLFQVSATLSLLPLVLGMLIAMLALVWRIGIGMREDLEGTV